MRVSIADLYLAWRQAKSALFFERRGVGLVRLAAFEDRLEQNLKRLQAKLGAGSWFSGIPLGDVWATPKRLRVHQTSKPDINRIGIQEAGETRELQVQLRCSPSPEFAIVEVLFLWAFGPTLERHLSEHVVGYRLDHKDDLASWKVRRWLYEFWPPTYAEFRTAPIEAARHILDKDGQASVVTADFASYYDTVHGQFLLDLWPAQDELLPGESSRSSYLRAATSLLAAHDTYRAKARKITGLQWQCGIPIGALTSRLVANLALAPIDKQLNEHARVACYRRYVDDILWVGAIGEAGNVKQELIDLFGGGLSVQTTDGPLKFDGDAFGRPGCEFQFQVEKVKVHHLWGRPGRVFLDAVQNDLQKIVSERRAFPDPENVASELVKRIVRAEARDGSTLRVFRDADRTRLEKYSLNTTLKGLERISSLIDKDEAAKLVRKSLAQVLPLLADHGDWVTELDSIFQVLRVALSADDMKSSRELIERSNQLFGTTESLKKHADSISFRGEPIASNQVWISLVAYLRIRLQEAVLGSTTARGVSLLSNHALALLGASRQQLERHAVLFAAADLRMHDREDDTAALREPIRERAGYLNRNNVLKARLLAIERFTIRLAPNDPWRVPAHRLFLATRPPSYFDIASRVLREPARGRIPEDTFTDLVEIVNAIRGSRYSIPEGAVHDEFTVSLDQQSSLRLSLPFMEAPEPKLILGNLTVRHAEWEASFRKPILSAGRLTRLARLLEKAALAAVVGGPRDNMRRSLLVLPELSLPRAWFRSIAQYVMKLSARAKFGFVVGLEYEKVGRKSVENQVHAVLPGPMHSVLTWSWCKEFAADGEAKELAKWRKVLVGPPVIRKSVLRTEYGDLSVLICSELLESSKVASLLGRAELVLVPAWNRDTTSYDHLIQSVGMHLNTIVAVANNGDYSDCRAWAPRKDSWERDLCRLVEKGEESVVAFTVPLNELRRHRSRGGHAPKYVRPKKESKKPPAWKPVPPDWPKRASVGRVRKPKKV